MTPEILVTRDMKKLPPEFANSTTTATTRSFIVLISLALVALILAVYMRAGSHQFINLDDNVYVTDNPHVATGITGNNIIWAFTSVAAGNWHPLTWLSHMADVQLFGMNPRGHHLTSVALHALTTVTLFLLLFRLSGTLWPGAFVAALFGLHPLHVESVAWVAERKDVLSALCWFSSLLFYTGYVAKCNKALYLLALLAFIAGLMAKPMLVTLPIVMLLLDYWPLNRWRHAAQAPAGHLCSGRAATLLYEKLPFFVCSLLSGLVTIYAQQQGAAIATLSVISFRLRIENALIAYVTYIGKILWPRDLAVFYPFPAALPLWQVIAALVMLVLVSAAALSSRRQHPCFAVGWFWFVITLVPVIGLLQVGSQSLADRYTYIPATGLFISAAWGVPELTRALRYQRSLLALLAGAVIITAAALTWQQLGYWRDNITLYRHTLEVTGDNAMIHGNLGAALAMKGELDAAIEQYEKAIRLNPGNKNSHYNLGIALQTKGNHAAAIREYRLSLQIFPGDADVHTNLGRALAGSGDPDGAMREYREAIRLNPNHAIAHNNLGSALATTGNLTAAIAEFQLAARSDPNNRSARNNLAQALAQKRLRDAAGK